MRKFSARLAVIAAASAVLVGSAGTAQAATVPTISFSPATTAVTLPAGCAKYLDVQLKPTSDGSYRGFVSAQCGSAQKVFYLQRNPAGVWALRTTPYAIHNGVQDVAVDSTGTYFLALDTQNRMMLGKRQNNGAFIPAKVLGREFVEAGGGSLIASNGQFWATWNDVLSLHHKGARDGLWETKTIGTPVTQGPVGQKYHDQGYLLQAAGGAFRLATFDEIGENDPAMGYEGTGRLTISSRHGTGWAGGVKALGDDIVTGSPKRFGTFGDRLYAVSDLLCHPNVAYDETRRPMVATEQGSGFAAAELDGTDGQTCADTKQGGDSAQNGYLLKIGTQVWVTDDDQVWKANSAGTFSRTPADLLAGRPTGMTTVQDLYRSGRIVRLLSSTSNGALRLSEQISQ